SRSRSVRVPVLAFFKVAGVVLFAMAVIFAGKGVFELQSAGLIRVTPLAWLGEGLPILGVYPNMQAVSVQGLLLSGAVLALVLLLLDNPTPATPNRSAASQVPANPSPTA